MIKSRTLPVDLGDRTDGKYHNFGESGALTNTYNVYCVGALGGTFYHTTQHYEKPCFNELSSLYNKSRNLAASNSWIPTSLGQEYLQSTTRPKPHFNECTHSTVQGFNYPFLHCGMNTNGSFSLQPYMKWAPPGQSIANIGDLSPSDWSAWSDVQRRAWWSMQPRFETEIALLNFIYEMKDFKRMARYLLKFKFTEIGQKLRGLRNRLRQLDGGIKSTSRGGKTLAQITRTAAEARLVSEFAIKPLISDLTTIFKTVANVIELTQQQFADRGNLHQISHYSEDGPTIMTGSYSSANLRSRFLGNVQQSRFTATLQYSYRYDMRKGWDLLSRSMGLEFNAETFWNMIPFSFLADYVYKVGTALHTMRTDPNVNMRLLQYCESILQTRSTGYHVDKSSPYLRAFYCPCSNQGELGLVSVAGYRKTLYRRRLAHPNKGAAMPKFASPTQGQLYNLAALVRCFFK